MSHCFLTFPVQNQVTKAFEELVELRNQANGCPGLEWSPAHHHLLECVELVLRNEAACGMSP